MLGYIVVPYNFSLRGVVFSNFFYLGDVYYSIMIFFIISSGLAGVLIILPSLLNFKAYSHFQEKNSSYECGFEPFSSAHKTFDVHFVVVAVLFLLFDFELLMLFPYVIGYDYMLRYNGPFSAFNLFFFLFLLLVGFIYE